MSTRLPDPPHIPLYRVPGEPVGPHAVFENLLGPFGPVCGVDEAGRGPLAGPVVAAAVILPSRALDGLEGLDDSKALGERRREQLFERILTVADVGIASISAATIDATNIRTAALQAMSNAVAALARRPAHALIDGNAVPAEPPCPCLPLIKGDSRSASIAAASIVAKVLRDRALRRADPVWSGYGLAAHKGYPTTAHREALARLGASPLHRHSFAPVRAVLTP